MQLKQRFSLGVALALLVASQSVYSQQAQESCTDEASVQRVEQQIAEKQQQAKAWDTQQKEALLAVIASEKQKKNWSEPKVKQILAQLLTEKEFIAFEQQKRPQTSALIKIIRELRSSKEGERDLKKECLQAQQITDLLAQGLKVNEQQYEWMRRYIQEAK